MGGTRPQSPCPRYSFRQYHHLNYDGTPSSQSLVRSLVRWLPSGVKQLHTKRISSLNHKAFDDAVEDVTVVVVVTGMGHKVLDGLGALVREEREMDIAQSRANDDCRREMRPGLCDFGTLLLRRFLVKDITASNATRTTLNNSNNTSRRSRSHTRTSQQSSARVTLTYSGSCGSRLVNM